MRTFLAVSAMLSVSMALAQSATTVPTEPVSCDAQNITTRVVAVQRIGPGQLVVDVEYENSANFPVQLNAANGVSLFDSNGEKWEGSGNSLSKNGEVPAGIKFKQRYRFTKQAGGNDVETVNFIHQFRVWSKHKLRGTCKFDAKNLPVTAKKGDA